jgi:hypothetical protein
VTEAAEHANCTVKKQDKFDQMLKLQARLGNWELIKPGEYDNRNSSNLVNKAKGDYQTRLI